MLSPEQQKASRSASLHKHQANECKDWRQQKINLKDRQRHVLKEGHLKDITFLVGPDKTPLHAHKMVISFASPVFEAMFYGFHREIGEKIEIPDISSVGFQLLLDFIYTDDVKFKDENEALAAWIAADKYDLSHMAQKCEKYLLSYALTRTNVWTMLDTSVLLDSPSVMKRCFDYLKSNISEALKTPNFLEINPETLKKILLTQSLNVKEITLLRSVVLWAQERMKYEAERNLNELLKPFIGHIHFGCLSQLEFANFIHEYPNVISDSDALAILKFMINDKQYSLPQWCCNNTPTRKYCERQRRLK